MDVKNNYTPEYVKALKKLTYSEIKVLDKVAEGYTSKEIAKILNNSPRTIEKHRENINKKLNLKHNGNLFQWCEEYVNER
ncbi:response regulator transcription factor [Fodinibius halophilus]|nr:helix-turn-helix transcriptional regulator [Fodinibius halophilus]